MKQDVLGIRSAVQLAPSAFLASAAGSSGLVSQLVPTQLQDVPLVARPEALSQWALGHDSPPPPDPVAHRQKMWDHPRVCTTAQAFTDETQDERSRARLLAACKSESGAWVQALPTPRFCFLQQLPFQHDIYDCLQQLSTAEAKIALFLVEGEPFVLLHLWQLHVLLCPSVH